MYFSKSPAMKSSTIILLIIFIGHARETSLEELHGPLFLPAGELSLGGEFGHIHLIVDLKAIRSRELANLKHIDNEFLVYVKTLHYSNKSRVRALADLRTHEVWVKKQLDLMLTLFGITKDRTKRQIFAALGAIFGLAQFSSVQRAGERRSAPVLCYNLRKKRALWESESRVPCLLGKKRKEMK